MQDDLLPDLSVLVHLGLKSVDLGAGDDAASAPNYDHMFHQLAVQS
jgi:hypothetical protein